MKQFFKYVLATIVGIIILGFLSILIFGGIIATTVSKSMKEKDVVEIGANSILKISLDTPVNDRPYRDADFFEEFLPVDVNGNLGLYPVIQALEEAKDDDEIRGIYLEINAVPTGFANLSALQRAFEDFKESGKFVVANSRIMTQKAYGIASLADEIYLHPEGFMDFKGLSAQIMFIKGTLDKLGVEPMIFYAGKFKSATEPLRRTNMSEENKLQTKEFIEDIYGNYLEMVAKNRSMDVTTLRDIADNMKVRKPEDAVSLGLVDGLKYDDEITDILKEKIGFEEDEDLEFVNLIEYSKSREIDADGRQSGTNRIAVIYAEGEIGMGDEEKPDNITGDAYAEIIRKVRKNDKIKAVVLRVNSPGGSAFASDLIWRELELLKEKKPLIVSMGNYAASGGYFIACNSDKIYAEENTITGSIGVFGVLMNVQKLLEDKLGITTDGVSTGKFSDFPNPAKKWSEEEIAIVQGQIDDIYNDFINKVAEGRQMNVEQVQEIAQGRVWSGQDALEIGLVDEIGSLEDAIADAVERVEVDDYKISVYPRVKSDFERIMEMFDIEAKADKKIKKELGQYAELFDYLQYVQQMEQPQMRIPYKMEIE